MNIKNASYWTLAAFIYVASVSLLTMLLANHTLEAQSLTAFRCTVRPAKKNEKVIYARELVIECPVAL